MDCDCELLIPPVHRVTARVTQEGILGCRRRSDSFLILAVLDVRLSCGNLIRGTGCSGGKQGYEYEIRRNASI